MPPQGLTIPSQIRYVHYFEQAVFRGKPKPQNLILCSIVLRSVPKFSDDIRFSIYSYRTLLHCYKDSRSSHPKKKDKVSELKSEVAAEAAGTTDSDADDNNSDEECLTFDCKDLPLTGDVKVVFQEKGKTLFTFWFNTDFIVNNKVPAPLLLSSVFLSRKFSFFCFMLLLSLAEFAVQLVIPKAEMDKAFKDMRNHKLYPPKFRAVLNFKEFVNNLQTDDGITTSFASALLSSLTGGFTAHDVAASPTAQRIIEKYGHQQHNFTEGTIHEAPDYTLNKKVKWEDPPRPAPVVAYELLRELVRAFRLPYLPSLLTRCRRGRSCDNILRLTVPAQIAICHERVPYGEVSESQLAMVLQMAKAPRFVYFACGTAELQNVNVSVLSHKVRSL